MLLPALLIYDTILNFAQEVRCIWMRKWSGATLIYTVIRYITVLGIIFQVLGELSVPSNVQRCQVFHYGSIVLSILSLIAIPVFECLRVWAIGGQSWWLASVVLILGLLAPAVDIYGDSLPYMSVLISSGPLSGCWSLQEAPSFPYFGPVIRAVNICSDIIVLIVTVQKTVHMVRMGQNTSANTKFFSLLLYTGCIQFILLLSLNIVDILFDILAIRISGAPSSQVIIIIEGLSAIIICRLILNLRSVEFQDGTHNGTEATRSSIRFTQSAIGNLGASTRIDSLAFSSAELDDMLENENTVYSDNPLRVGLIDQTEGAEIEMQPLEECEGIGPSGHHHEDMEAHPSPPPQCKL
ncbi:hypothetical protein K474DRAFT_1656589 [Panus rudis PR-1116 ss-1]|nr:hypothetical protein K474DRAFT_1656589 [Panus rudis PR-1116 ss-1]